MSHMIPDLVASVDLYNLVALATLLLTVVVGATSAVFVGRAKGTVGGLNQALAASRATAEAWKEERDAEKSRAERLMHERETLRDRVNHLEARPDIDRLYEVQVDTLNELKRHSKEETAVWVALMNVLPEMKASLDEMRDLR